MGRECEQCAMEDRRKNEESVIHLLQLLAKSVKKVADLLNVGDVRLCFSLFLANSAGDRVGDFIQQREHNFIRLAVANAHQEVNILKMEILEDSANSSCFVNGGWSKFQSLVTENNLETAE